MRLATFTVIGALGLAAAAGSVRAAPIVPTLDAHQAPGIVQVWGGCGPGFRPVPGHWSQWRGAWVAPHCAPNYYRPYGNYYRPYGPYAGYRPYWGYHRHYW